MGRGTLEIKYKKNLKDRLITFGKKKANIIKKASELGQLCGVDIGLVFSTPTRDQLLLYSTKNTVEEVFDILKSTPPQKRGKHYTGEEFPNKIRVLETQEKRRQKVREDREKEKNKVQKLLEQEGIGTTRIGSEHIAVEDPIVPQTALLVDGEGLMLLNRNLDDQPEELLDLETSHLMEVPSSELYVENDQFLQNYGGEQIAVGGPIVPQAASPIDGGDFVSEDCCAGSETQNLIQLRGLEEIEHDQFLQDLQTNPPIDPRTVEQPAYSEEVWENWDNWERTCKLKLREENGQ